MPAPRFHVDLPLSAGTLLALPDPVAHHAGRVLRLREGDTVVLFNGEGGEYAGELRFAGKRADVLLGPHDPREAELAGPITLVQGIASGDKMDWIIEKAVETGVHAIVPIAAERSVLKLAGDRLDKRVAHWRRVAQAACEQCGRNRVPAVHAPLTLAQYLEGGFAQPALLCHPEAEASLSEHLLATRPEAMSLWVGPEGGWSDEELRRAQAAGVRPVRFGARVLRTETAGTALIAAASALLGWV